MAQLFGSLLIFLSCHPSSNAAQMLVKTWKDTTYFLGKVHQQPTVANKQPFYFVFGSFKCRNLRVFWCAGMEGLVRVIYWLVLCFFHVPTVCWFFSLPYNSHKYLYSKWRNAQDSRGSWAIYRTLFGSDCACKMGFLDGASPKWKWPLRHLYHCRVCLSCAIYFHIGVYGPFESSFWDASLCDAQFYYCPVMLPCTVAANRMGGIISIIVRILIWRYCHACHNDRQTTWQLAGVVSY